MLVEKDSKDCGSDFECYASDLATLSNSPASSRLTRLDDVGLVIPPHRWNNLEDGQNAKSNQ